MEDFLEKLIEIFENVENAHEELKELSQTNFYPHLIVDNVVRLIKISSLDGCLPTNQSGKVNCEKLKRNVQIFILEAQKLIKDYEIIIPFLEQKYPDLLNYEVVRDLTNKFNTDFNNLTKKHGLEKSDEKESE